MNLKYDAKLRRKSADYKKMAEIFTQLLRQTKDIMDKTEGEGSFFVQNADHRVINLFKDQRLFPMIMPIRLIEEGKEKM